MKGFGVHTSMWTMSWDADGAARAIAAAKASGMDFIEIALLDPASTDAALGRRPNWSGLHTTLKERSNFWLWPSKRQLVWGQRR